MSGNVISAIRAWSPAVLGMGTNGDPVVKTATDSTIIGGREGTIYFENDLVEAFGICARGRREDNEDGIGVQEREDGSLLFHVADGAGGFDAGEIASAMVIKGMAYFYGIEVRSFNKARRLIVDQMKKEKVPKEAATTYAGLFIDQRSLQLLIGIIGDSQISATDTESGEEIYTSTSHGLTYERAHMMEQGDLIRAIRYCGRNASEFIRRPIFGWSKSDLRALRLLYEYSDFRRNFITRFITPAEPHEVDTDKIRRRTGNGYLYTIYTDGVSDLFTPIDIADEFVGNNIPLHEKGLRFAEKIMLAQGEGREIDIGGKKKLKIPGKKDNYTFWLIRLKK